MAIVNQIKATSSNETRDIHDYRLTEDDGTIKTSENIESSGNVKGASATFPSINGETNPSVKPLYYHPITMYDNGVYSGGRQLALSFTILNNDPTPFTLQTFIQWIKNLVDSIIAGGGSYANLNTDGGYEDIISSAYLYASKSGSDYIGAFVGFDTNGYKETEIQNLDNYFENPQYISFYDGVNKIN